MQPSLGLCSAFAVLAAASPLVVPLEPLTLEDVNQYFIPAKIGSQKREVLLQPWGSSPVVARYVLDLLDDTFCPQAIPVVPEDECQAYLGGLYEPRTSTTYDPDDDDQGSSDLLYGADNLEMVGVMLSNVSLNAWGVRDDGNTSYQGARPRLSYFNTSTIWDQLFANGGVTSRSLAHFAGTIAQQDSATLAEGQYPGSLIFGGYDKNLIKGPVLSSPMQRYVDDPDGVFSSPSFLVTRLEYTHPGNATTVLWSNDTGFVMDIQTRTNPAGSFGADALYLPDAVIDQFVQAAGANTSPATSGPTGDIFSEDTFTLSDDAVVGDLMVTLRHLDSQRVADYGIESYPADLSQLQAQGLNPQELTILVPAANLRLKQFADYSYRIDDGSDTFNSPRNYTGYQLAVRRAIDDDRLSWGRPFLQSIYQVIEYDLGLYHLAQANFENAMNSQPAVESLDTPFLQSFKGVDETVDGNPNDSTDQNQGQNQSQTQDQGGAASRVVEVSSALVALAVVAMFL